MPDVDVSGISPGEAIAMSLFRFSKVEQMVIAEDLGVGYSTLRAMCSDETRVAIRPEFIGQFCRRVDSWLLADVVEAMIARARGCDGPVRDAALELPVVSALGVMRMGGEFQAELGRALDDRKVDAGERRVLLKRLYQMMEAIHTVDYAELDAARNVVPMDRPKF